MRGDREASTHEIQPRSGIFGIIVGILLTPLLFYLPLTTAVQSTGSGALYVAFFHLRFIFPYTALVGICIAAPSMSVMVLFTAVQFPLYGYLLDKHRNVQTLFLLILIHSAVVGIGFFVQMRH